MSRHATWLALGSWLVFGAAGCAGRLDERVTTMEQQVAALQRDQALAVSRLDESNRVAQNVYLLQDRVEQMSLMLERMQSGVPEAEGEVPSEAPEVEAAPQLKYSPAPKAKAKGAPQASVANDDPVTTYRKAYDLLKAADYAGSSALFQQLIDRFPDHELADNAQYWLGETDYAQKNYRRALDGFQRVVDVYPNGNKVPDAMLKLAFCQIELGEKSKAKETLQSLIRDFPWSEPARKAKERLQTLG